MSTDMNQHPLELIAALEKPEDMSTEALQSAIQNGRETILERQKEWARIQRRANFEQHTGDSAENQRPRLLMAANRWDRVLEASERLNELLGNFERDRRNRGDTGQASEQPSPEGVVAASAARSPGVPVAELSPVAAKRPAAQSKIPKELVIDMVDDLAATEAKGRGKCVRKPRTFFEEVAAPSKGKRKRATDEELKSTTTLPPSKKRAMSRDVSVVPADIAASATHAPPSPPKRAGCAASRNIPPAPLPPANNKRKRAADNDEAATAAPPPTKRRTTCRATSAASTRVTRSAPSRAASAGPSRAPSSAPPRTKASSASPSAPPAPRKRTGAASSIAPFIAFARPTAATPLYFMPGISTPLFCPYAPAPPASNSYSGTRTTPAFA